MTKQISVLHVVLSTNTGGMENVIYNLACAHDRNRLQLQIACLEAVGPVSEKLRGHGIVTDLLPRMIPGVSMIFPWSLIRYIKQSKCDIVHTHSGCWSKVAIACAWNPRVKLVYTDHGRAFPEKRGRIFQDRIAARITDRVVAVGEPLREYLLDTVLLSPEKVITIPNGIDTNRFRPPTNRTIIRQELGFNSGDIVIVMVARLAPVKNHRLLIETFRGIADGHPEVRLLIVGDGPLREELEQLVNAMSLSERVKFTGDRADVELLLGAADLATLCSKSEGISLTLLEAMATGLPVVATSVGGNPTIITDGREGFLVSQESASYAAALTKLIEFRDLRRILGTNARTTVVDRWSVKQMANQYEALYAELVV